ncbi:MAG: hypothetical protein N838_19540 [Thiohalocapsa sp. PB-PSB1]|nr:MAG: hypothetical protein N838_19540 [Thiohalocapsa sp. PB-PSB1]
MSPADSFGTAIGVGIGVGIELTNPISAKLLADRWHHLPGRPQAGSYAERHLRLVRVRGWQGPPDQIPRRSLGISKSNRPSRPYQQCNLFSALSAAIFPPLTARKHRQTCGLGYSPQRRSVRRGAGQIHALLSVLCVSAVNRTSCWVNGFRRLLCRNRPSGLFLSPAIALLPGVLLEGILSLA